MAKYTIKYPIRTSDLNQFDDLKPYIYFDMFQDIAGFHAEELNVGYEDTIKNNIAWILMKNKVSIYGKATKYDVLTVITYPTEKNKIDFYRDYEVYSSKNELIARGTSQWCIVDTKTKKILRTTSINFPESLSEPSFFKEKITKINYNNLNELTKYGEYQIKLSDIDHYHHTNNARYVEILYNILNLENKNIKEIIINYNNETKLNEIITIYAKNFNNIEEEKIEGIGVNADGKTCFSFSITNIISK